jgi:hypothetical protein
MKVHRVTLDVNNFQGFLPTDSKIWKTNILDLNCKPKGRSWNTLDVFIDNPVSERGNFFSLCAGAFVTDGEARKKLLSILEMGGELLPINHKGETLHLFNALECVNCLNDEATSWIYGEKTGAKIMISRYQFFPDRFSESTLFKIPETRLGEILTVSGIRDREDEFKGCVEDLGLKGIIFEELWSG